MFPRLRRGSRLFVTGALVALPVLTAAQKAPRIEITPNESARRIDVTVDGKPFTSYIYPETLKKPSLWPIRSAKGTLITRGFPMEPRPRERTDHPHQVGLWFNHGDVNGFDFWGHSDATKQDQKPKMGTILHRKVGKIQNGEGHAELNTESDWVAGDGTTLLREQTRFIFRAGTNVRTIDRIATLTALDKRVVFNDTKEGVFGLRVTRALEHPAEKPEVFLDASGQATKVPVLDNTGVTGSYTSVDGIKGEKVWGTRGRWMILGGTVDGEPVTVAIIDHPSNPGYPTHWHARGYGLFAANMLGRSAFPNEKEKFNFTIEPGKSATFRYRVVIFSGAATPEKVEAEYKAFASGS